MRLMRAPRHHGMHSNQQVFDTMSGWGGDITDTVASGDAVKLSGFGTFEKANVAARAGRNPKTGETISIPPTVRPRFTPGATFKALVKG